MSKDQDRTDEHSGLIVVMGLMIVILFIQNVTHFGWTKDAIEAACTVTP